MHPALGEQLPHPGIDDRVAGATELPARQPVLCVGAGVPLHPVHRRIDRSAGRVGVVEQHIRVELPPGQLSPKARRAFAAPIRQAGQQGPRVDCSPLEIRRHPTGPIEIRTITVGGVIVEIPLQESTPGGLRSAFTGVRQRRARLPGEHFGRLPVLAGQAGRVDPADAGPGSGRRAPAVRGPGAEERRENRVPAAIGLADAPRSHRVRRTCCHQADLVVEQGVVHGVVAPAAIGSEIRSDMHLGRLDRSGQLWHDAVRPAVHDQQTAAERVVQSGERRRQEVPAWEAGRPHECVVHNEKGKHVAVPGGGGEQRRVVIDPQITSEPQYGRPGHALTVPAVPPANPGRSGRHQLGNIDRCRA